MVDTVKNNTVESNIKIQRPRGTYIKKFVRNKRAMAGLIILLLELLVVIVGPLVYKTDPNFSNYSAFNKAPSSEYILGTDDTGRDILARLLAGGRVSLLVGIASTLISVAIGIPLGLLAGYFRGIFETIVMRAADIFMSFPTTILCLVLVSVFGSNISTMIIVIGVIEWVGIAKLIYGNVLMIRTKEFVEAEKALGNNSFKIMLKDVLPNAMTPVWASIAFNVVNAIKTESSLSFLGCGIQPPQASWGNIINAAQNLMVLKRRWWIWVPAGLCLVITVVSINFLGEGIRDVVDPKTN